MSYNIKYTVPFKSINDVPCIIEILEDGFTGVATELTGGTTPFKVKLDDEDFLYIPLRFSSATIKLVGGDYMQSLFSTNYQQFKVVFKRNNVVKWIGFIKPEVYTQDYSVEPFELEIQCQSALSVLEFIDYKTAGEKIDFISLFDLIARSILESKGNYQNVYIPHVYARDAATYNSLDNVLSEMKVSEQNFFDEESEPMKFKEVLEEVCKLLNWTCHVWGDSVYFIDINHSGQYYKFNSDLSSFEMVNLLNTVNVQNVGFSGSSHSLDILGGYNKVKVRTSNYSIGSIFSNDNYDDLDILQTKDYTKDKGICHKLFLNYGKTKLKSFVKGENGSHNRVEDISGLSADELNSLYGAIPVRYCNYEIYDNGKASISSYSYTDVIQVRQTSKPGSLDSFAAGIPMIIINGASSIYSDGALSITGSVKACTSSGDMNPLFMDKMTAIALEMKIRIGNKFWDFSEKCWTEKEKYPGRYGINVQDRDSTDYASLKKNKTLDMPYSGTDGYIIPINEILAGDIEITVFAPTMMYDSDFRIACGYYLKDFKIEYVKKDGIKKEENNSDRCYENIVNENFITDLDEIEFKISSYNNDGACYSKVLLGDKYLTDNLYSIISGKQIRLEEHLIRRIINQYQATKIKLTQILKYTDSITPATTITDTYMGNRNFIMTGGEIDFEQEEFNCIMIEFNGNYQE